MNAERRKQIEKVKEKLTEKFNELISEIKEEIELIQEQEQDYFDNIPENFQSGEKGDKSQAAIDSLQEAIDNLEYLDLDSITDSLTAAAE